MKPRFPIFAWGAAAVCICRPFPRLMLVMMYVAATLLTLPVMVVAMTAAVRARNRFEPVERRGSLALALGIGASAGWRSVWHPVLGRS